jgi:predicted transcriptional regulator
MMTTRGFGEKWRDWIMRMVKEGSISIRINDENSSYFNPDKGLRQEVSLSPMLFNL